METLSPLKKEEVQTISFADNTEGEMNGRTSLAYKEEPGVNPSSQN